MALAVIVVEGLLLYLWYDRYYGHYAASYTATGKAASPKETTSSESTSPGGSTDRKRVESTQDAGNVDSGEKASEPTGEITFTHTATDANSRGDYTYISDPAIDADPDALVLAAPAPEGRGSASASAYAYGHNIGVWYEGADKRKWAIFNQDRVAAGATFEVVIPPASESFVHRAEAANTVGNATYLDDPLTNGEPGATVSVTQNWNPGGGRGVYNDHPVGVRYDQGAQQWVVYNLDGALMPIGAAFNVAFRPQGAQPAR